ncbi:MAG: hypothetical protein NTY09_06470 [bacterium]|nr:hypothetical protein [bacterium]
MRYRNYIPLLTLFLAVGFILIPTGAVRANDYPDTPEATQEVTPGGDYSFPEAEASLNPSHISDAIVSLNVTNGDFVQVLMILTQQAGVNFILDAYWNMLPSGHIREGYRPPGGPDANGGAGGFGGGGFNPTDSSGGGTVTMNMSETPFDEVFGYLMQAYNLDYMVMRSTPDADPILYIGTRERLETELGLGEITMYMVHYIDADSALDFLRQMDLLPTTSGYGIWRYDGGGGNSGGNNGGGSGGGGTGSGGGFGGRGGGGSGHSAGPFGYWFDPTQFTITGIDPDDLDGRGII